MPVFAGLAGLDTHAATACLFVAGQ